MLKKTRILVVDDEMRGVELLVRTLRGIGDVETSCSADEGWELFQRTGFNLVVSDQRMPGMSGIELLSRVAEAAPATGRILLTGYTDLEATLNAINRGQVHAYLTKPCAPPEVQEAVRGVLERVRRSTLLKTSAGEEIGKQLTSLIETAKRIRAHATPKDPIEELADELIAEAEALLDSCCEAVAVGD